MRINEGFCCTEYPFQGKEQPVRDNPTIFPQGSKLKVSLKFLRVRVSHPFVLACAPPTEHVCVGFQLNSLVHTCVWTKPPPTGIYETGRARIKEH